MAAVSLNRYEQILRDYIENHPDEKRFWKARVAEVASRPGRRESQALDLNAALWDYFEERSRHESPFREIAAREGLQRISMLNLSEYWIRLWGPPAGKPKR